MWPYIPYALAPYGLDAHLLGWQKILEAKVVISRVGLEEAALEAAQFVRRLFGRAVNEIGVQRAGDDIHRRAST